jgi:Domain of unknown function (DUF2017)
VAGAFKRVGDHVRVRLGQREVEVLRTLPEQLRSVLGQDAGAPTDPVAERLFPPAYRDAADRERDDEYQRLVHDDLLNAKLANLDALTASLERGTVSLRRWTVDLSEDEALAWLGALNDLRLALGVRLGIKEDFDGSVADDDPAAPATHLLSYLGWLQELLLEALSG